MTARRDMTARPRARAFIRDQLAGGAIPAATIWSRAAAAGFAIKTIDKAKADLGIRSRHDGARWWWYDPNDESPLADIDLVGAEARLTALDAHAGRATTSSAAACRCMRPLVDDGSCTRCGRAVPGC